MQVLNWSVPLALASWKIFYVPTGRQYSYLGTCLHEVAVMSVPHPLQPQVPTMMSSIILGRGFTGREIQSFR
jgi:hypothetical protein